MNTANMNGAVPPLAARGRWCVSPRFLVLLSPLVFALALSGNCLSQTELGSEDDLTVMGTDGDAVDPDVEIKGFSVFGSTQTSYAGAVVGPGNVVVNGVLAVSSGAYFVGNSTFTAAGNIFINDGAAGQLLRRHSAGYLEWANSASLGDNLGNHVATTTLNMAGNSVLNVDSMSVVGQAGYGGAIVTISTGTSTMVEIKGTGEILAKKITVQSGVAAKISTDEGDIAIEPAGGNVNVSGNLNVANGFIYYGDGSGLTNLSGVSPVGSALTSANVWVGDASNLAAARAMSGDATLSNTGVVTLKNTGTSGTYRSVTTDAQGRVSGGTNPTTFAGYGLSDTSANLAAIITDETGTGALVFGTAPAFTGMTNSGAYTQSGTSANTLTGAVTASNAAGVTTPKVKLLAGVELSSTTAANYGGVYSSSHVYVNGDVHALKYYGNGSGLSGVAGDNLGNHTATQDLNLAGNSVLNVDSMSVVGQAGYGGSILTISTGTSTMVEIKGTGEILAKQITVQSGVAAKISSDVGDIAIEPAGGNVNVLGSLNVTSGSNVGLEGASGDTYMKYNSGYISMYVNGLEVARFKP